VICTTIYDVFLILQRGEKNRKGGIRALCLGFTPFPTSILAVYYVVDSVGTKQYENENVRNGVTTDTSPKTPAGGRA
jgi:hypothetical protein